MGIVPVVGERFTRHETEAFIEPLRRLEGRHRTGLEAEPFEVTAPCHLDDVRQQRPPRATTPQLLGGAHRFHLAMPLVQLLQRSAAQQQWAVPGRPERDRGRAQGRQIERMHALGRRQRMHAAQMLLEQGVNGRVREVIDFDVHARFGCGRAEL